MKTKKVSRCGTKIMQGNIACAEGALAAGCRFFAGYPITPASEIAEHFSGAILKDGGTYVQMEDELGSLCAVIGASWGGVRSMTATSGPGFSLMMESLGYAIVNETPLVIVDVMRGGPSTGQPTSSSQQDVMQAKYGTHGDYELIALTPSSVQEMFDFTVRAFNLADKYRVPVIILADEVVGHMREKITIPEEIELFDEKYQGITRTYFKPDKDLIPPRIRFFEGHSVLVDGQLHDERSIRAGHIPEISAAAVQRYCNKILKNIDDITDVESYCQNDMEIGVIAYGSVSRSALSAVKLLREQGIKAGMLKINSVWPFPEKQVADFSSRCSKIYVPEMNIGRYCREIARAAGNSKVVSIPSLGGILHTPDVICDVVKGDKQ